MVRFASAGLITAGLVGLLSGCSPDETIVSDAIAPTESTPQTTSLTAKTSNPASEESIFDLAPGRYCYLLNNGILTTYLRLTLNNNQLTGDARSSVQNEETEQADPTIHSQAFAGSLTENKAAVDITTWVEADIQETRETWTLTNNTLQTKERVLNLADCEIVDPAFQDHNGLEAKDLIDGANNVRTQRIEFSPGRQYAVASDSVVRGDRDVYLLRAGGGQQMSLYIQSLEDNAVFDVISPGGYILAFSAIDETFLLPHTGDYQVVVGGTRGNATYDLTIGIR